MKAIRLCTWMAERVDKVSLELRRSAGQVVGSDTHMNIGNTHDCMCDERSSTLNEFGYVIKRIINDRQKKY